MYSIYRNTIEIGGRSGRPGRFSFYPEGRTYSPPAKRAVVCLRHRALSEGDAASAEAYIQCHKAAALLPLDASNTSLLTVSSLLFDLRKPATGSFVADTGAS